MGHILGQGPDAPAPLSANPGGPALPTQLSHADATRVQLALDSSIADSTKTAYSSDWRAFVSWCQLSQYVSLPASAETVMAYLTGMESAVRPTGERAYAVATIVRRAASINAQHVAAGLTPPGADGRVARVLKSIRRERSSAQRQVAPLLTSDIHALLEGTTARDWPDGVAAVRDAALLLVGFAGAYRRSELASLNVSDVVPDRDDGMHMRLRRSKADQEGEGAVKGLPRGRTPLMCPPCAVYRWLELLDAADHHEGRERRRALMRVLHADERREGHLCREWHTRRVDDERPLFRSLAGGGVIKPARISGHAINEMIKRRVEGIGLDPAQYGGHSLRAGFITQAFKAGADSRAIRRQTLHKGDAILAVYDREKAPLRGNAVEVIGL